VSGSGLGLKPHPFLNVGQRVQIEGGALDGLEGMIEDTKTRNRLIVSVSLLQRSVAVEIDSAWVTPVQSPSRAVVAKPVWSPV
jgi:transcription antitermination factor NusG